LEDAHILTNLSLLEPVHLGAVKSRAIGANACFHHVNVVDTRAGRILPGMTVVVRSGRIQGVARVGLIAENRNVRMINAAGKYMMPGLWDMDVRTASTAAAWDAHIIYPLYVTNGVTGVRDMGGDPDLLDQRSQRVEDGTLPGPHILVAGPILSGGKSNTQTVAPLNNPTEVREAVVKLKEHGMDLLTMRSDISRDSYYALADEAARLKIQFAGPVPDSITVAEASAAGQKSIERLSGILLACSSKEEMRQNVSTVRSSAIPRSRTIRTIQPYTSPWSCWNRLPKASRSPCANRSSTSILLLYALLLVSGRNGSIFS
jgi:hypothetical protein